MKLPEPARHPEPASEDVEMRASYDFSGGVRGKYANRFSPQCTVVMLDPDVAEAFPDGASVNAALRRAMAGREG